MAAPMRRTQDCELTADPITCFDECNGAMKERIRDYFTKWSKHFRDDARRLTDAELGRLADELGFRGWTSAESVPPIKFQGPKLDSNRIQVGRFIKDLPDPKKARTVFQDDWENDLFDFLGKPSDYVVPRDRKAGEAAYMRARLGKLQRCVVTDFIDRSGRWVPVSHIDFRNGGKNEPSDQKLSAAYVLADSAWADACDEWNQSLCVYLCRRKLFNFTQLGPDPREKEDEKEKEKEAGKEWEEREKRDYSDKHFLRAPQIREQMPNMLRRLQVAVNDLEQGGNEGRILSRSSVHRFPPEPPIDDDESLFVNGSEAPAGN